MKSLLLRGNNPLLYIWLGLVVLSLFMIGGCSVAEPKAVANTDKPVTAAEPANASGEAKPGSIAIEPNGPADTVRAFYALLRERKFRDAMFLTNLKPAIQSLNDTELKDFALDFETLAGQVPPQVLINGEIITGDQATVTVKLPKGDSDEDETQPVKLRKDGDVWVILTADEEASKKIKKEGKEYFYKLRIETHQDEARKMLERISKAELGYALQNGGSYTDLATLVEGGLLPEDIQSSDSTGYTYALELVQDKYIATATPAAYAKSGKMSYLLYLDAKGMSHVKEKDNGGQVLRK
jgi:hypothetical protein